jgi:hypothetical protein
VLGVHPAWGRSALDVELELGGGYDGALFRLATAVPDKTETRDYYWHIEPELTFSFEPTLNHALRLGYAVAYRDLQSPTNGSSQGHSLWAGYALGLTPTVTFEVEGAGALEAMTALDAGYRTASAAVALRWRFMESVTLGAELNSQRFVSPAIESSFGGGALGLSWTSGRLDLAVKAQALSDGRDWRQVAALGNVALKMAMARVELDGGGATVTDGVWATYGGTVSMTLGDPWTVFIHYHRRWESYGETPQSRLPLWASNMGAGVRYSWESVPEGLVRVLRKSAQERVTNEAPSGVTLVVLTSKAGRVAVTGDFNDWDQEGVGLAMASPGRWQGHLDLAPGRYTYQVIVDGELRVPQGAEEYVSDGFGGTNALLRVGAGSTDTGTVEVRLESEDTEP